MFPLVRKCFHQCYQLVSQGVLNAFFTSKNSFTLIVEFAKLRASRALALYIPYALLTPHGFVPYVRSCLTCLHALRALRKPCVPFSQALKALFVPLKIFLGWICSPAETFHFRCYCLVDHKRSVKLFKWGRFLSTLTR